MSHSLYNAKISGTGSYLPEKKLTNKDLEKLVETNDEWIRERTGISSRSVAADNQVTSDLALEAAKKALDAGATGLVLPRIESAEMAENAVRFMKYPPLGVRGAGPRMSAFRDTNYFDTANDETLVVIMIETRRGVENIDRIFSVEGNPGDRCRRRDHNAGPGEHPYPRGHDLF